MDKACIIYLCNIAADENYERLSGEKGGTHRCLNVIKRIVLFPNITEMVFLALQPSGIHQHTSAQKDQQAKRE